MINKFLTVLPVLETATEGVDISGVISLVLPFAIVILVFYFIYRFYMFFWYHQNVYWCCWVYIFKS